MPDIYSTRTMMKAIEIGLKPKSFLRDTFFPNVAPHLTKKFEVDFKRGKRKMAPFVAPIVGGKTVTRDGYRTESYEPPKLAPQRILTADELGNREMGENVYSAKTPEERAANILAKDLTELDDMITRREEWMCRETLLNGKVTMRGYTNDDKYIEQEVDYGHDGIITLSGTDAWTDASSDILGFLKEQREAIIKATGMTPDIILMATDVPDLMYKNTALKAILDNKGINEGTITPSIKDEAVTFIGKINSLGAELYTYGEWFIDDDGVEQPMIPPGHVIYGKKGRGTMHYGPIVQIETGVFVTYEGSRVPKKWVDEPNEVQMIKLSSKPLPSPEDVQSWVVVNVKG